METILGNNHSGAVGAILDEYQRALEELKQIVASVSTSELLVVVDHDTMDSNCKSIQTVLAHVVRSGFTYAILVDSLKKPMQPYRERVYHVEIAGFLQDLDAMFAFNVVTLGKFQDSELEEFETGKKLFAPWGQLYDVEQIMEHAIVHILRHRRQIERFLRLLRRPSEPAESDH